MGVLWKTEALCLVLVLAIKVSGQDGAGDAAAAPPPAGAAGAAPSGKPLPQLLQPVDMTVKTVQLGSPEKAAELIKEMHQKWEGMDNPRHSPWETVYSRGLGNGKSNSPSALVGTPRDPFTPSFGPWIHPPRGVPPPQMYNTFIFDMKNPFKRGFLPKDTAEQPNPAPAGLWHPLLGVAPLESTRYPKVVVPVPRPIFRAPKKSVIAGTRPRDWVYERVPRRPQIVRDAPVPAKHPVDYSYPTFHILNPRSAFTMHSPTSNYQSFRQHSFLEEGNQAHRRTRRPSADDSIFLQEEQQEGAPRVRNDEQERPSRAKRNQQKPDAELTLLQLGQKLNAKSKQIDAQGSRGIAYRFYPMGRHGPAMMRGPPTIRRMWKAQDWYAADKNFQRRRMRETSLVDRMLGDPPGPYGHGYNHQPGAPAVPPKPSVVTKTEFDNTKMPNPITQVQDEERQRVNLKKLHNDPRMPYMYTQGKQAAEDYKMAPEPPLDDSGAAGTSEVGVQGPFEDLIREKHAAQPNPIHPNIQPHSHAFNLPAKRGSPTREEFQGAHADAKNKYVDHYPALKRSMAKQAAGAPPPQQPNPPPANPKMEAGPPATGASPNNRVAQFPVAAGISSFLQEQQRQIIPAVPLMRQAQAPAPPARAPHPPAFLASHSRVRTASKKAKLHYDIAMMPHAPHRDVPKVKHTRSKSLIETLESVGSEPRSAEDVAQLPVHRSSLPEQTSESPVQLEVKSRTKAEDKEQKPVFWWDKKNELEENEHRGKLNPYGSVGTMHRGQEPVQDKTHVALTEVGATAKRSNTLGYHAPSFLESTAQRNANSMTAQAATTTPQVAQPAAQPAYAPPPFTPSAVAPAAANVPMPAAMMGAGLRPTLLETRARAGASLRTSTAAVGGTIVDRLRRVTPRTSPGAGVPVEIHHPQPIILSPGTQPTKVKDRVVEPGVNGLPPIVLA